MNYIEIPNGLKEKLSLLISKQDKISEEIIVTMRAKDSKIIAKKIMIPVEFVLIDNILTYIKVANESFLKRLLLENDTSEIEPLEQDIYTQKGKINTLPLIEMSRIRKFEIDVPICVTFSHSGAIHIQNTLDYTELF